MMIVIVMAMMMIMINDDDDDNDGDGDGDDKVIIITNKRHELSEIHSARKKSNPFIHSCRHDTTAINKNKNKKRICVLSINRGEPPVRPKETPGLAGMDIPGLL